jgi:NitT/TauT family transport system permease protein
MASSTLVDTGGDLDRELAGLDALEAALPARANPLQKWWSSVWPPLAATALLISVWQVVVWTHWKPEVLLPSPFTVLKAMKGDLGTLWRATLTTLWRGVKGFAFAVVIGTVIGMIAARFKVVRTAIGSMITGLQTMPSVAWTPLAIVLFKAGGGDAGSAGRAILFVVVLGAAPSVANGLLDGIDNISPVLLRAGRVLGASGFASLRHVIVPAALPTFVSGLKQAWAFAWRALLGAELLVNVIGATSLGQQLNANMSFNDYTSMYGDMIAILIIGIVVDRLVFAKVEKTIRKRYGLIDAAT